eukprot:2465500-Amphidinium_carterae.1
MAEQHRGRHTVLSRISVVCVYRYFFLRMSIGAFTLGRPRTPPTWERFRIGLDLVPNSFRVCRVKRHEELPLEQSMTYSRDRNHYKQDSNFGGTD